MCPIWQRTDATCPGSEMTLFERRRFVWRGQRVRHRSWFNSTPVSISRSCWIRSSRFLDGGSISTSARTLRARSTRCSSSVVLRLNWGAAWPYSGALSSLYCQLAASDFIGSCAMARIEGNVQCSVADDWAMMEPSCAERGRIAGQTAHISKKLINFKAGMLSQNRRSCTPKVRLFLNKGAFARPERRKRPRYTCWASNRPRTVRHQKMSQSSIGSRSEHKAGAE